MSVANRNVIKAWMNGEKAINGRKSLHTDGIRLYSYRLLIGVNVKGTCYLGDYTAGGEFRSMTTSTHIGRARRAVRSIDVYHPAIFSLLADDLAKAAEKKEG
jgi:hypothetical protein